MDIAVLFIPALIELRTPTTPGIYILGNLVEGVFTPVYIGRADVSLRSRLRYHNHQFKATHVQWLDTETPEQAHYFECVYWHTYKDRFLLNKIHPASPQGSGMRCPVCSYLVEDTELVSELDSDNSDSDIRHA